MEIIHITNEDFEAEVLKSDLPVLIDFYADWCTPCKMVAPIVDEIATEHSDIKVVKVNVDEADEVAAKYDVMSIPTLILIKNGEVSAKTVGFQSKEKLLELFGL